MRLRFLCQRHRSLLENSADSARSTWMMSYDKALVFADEGRLEQAINAAGSALEAAEVLLREHARREPVDLQRFTESAVLLRSLLQELGDAALVSGLVGGCMARLDWAMAVGAPRPTVFSCCQRLLEAGESLPAACDRPAMGVVMGQPVSGAVH